MGVLSITLNKFLKLYRIRSMDYPDRHLWSIQIQNPGIICNLNWPISCHRLHLGTSETELLTNTNDNVLFLVAVDGNFELAYEALDAIQPDMQQ